MGFNKNAVTILALSLTAILSGCAQQSEKDMLAEAQFCLDKATNASSVNTCMAKIDGLTSEQSYSLRCAGGFVSAGITSPANLATAMNSMKQNASTASVLGVLAFDNQTLMDSTFDNCSKSGDAGLKLVAAMSKTATVIYQLTNASGTIEQQMTNAITSIITNLTSNNAAAQAAAVASATQIGGAIQTVYQASCSLNSVNTQMCGSISGALAAAPSINISTSSPQDIGAALLNYWQSTNH
ncbi:MAG: hypothetical protein ACXVCP_17430 [Bdellovibrio sp.]